MNIAEIGTIARIEKQGEQATSQINKRAWLYLVSDVLTWKDGIGQYLDDSRVQELAKKLCSKYAQKLYNPSNIENDELNDAGYKWNANTLELDKILKLKPFDKVLVRNDANKKWSINLFSYYNEEDKLFPYVCLNGSYHYCILYEGNEYLLGKNN